MEIKIGIQNVMRELVIETDDSAEQVTAQLEAAVKNGTLALKDNKGRTIVVPATALGYVEIGVEEPRRVGFGG